jgi:hypothetical protein
MGWIPGPSDVLSGYGVEANVANGGFEEVAPFGGWGWRCFDDPGVSRVYDPPGGGNPVFSTRVTFQAGSGDTVEIDDVVTMVPEPGSLAMLAAGAAGLLALGRLRARVRLQSDEAEGPPRRRASVRFDETCQPCFVTHTRVSSWGLSELRDLSEGA